MIKFRIPYPVSRIPKSGFSLLEVLVAVAVFVFVVASAGGIFVSIQHAWRRQKAAVNLIQNSRWAMEFMTNEIRQGGSITDNPPGPIPLGRGIRFRPPPGPPTPYVWYWRGNGGVTGNTNVIYRGTGAGFGTANGNRKELANFIVDNPDLVTNTTGFPPSGDGTDPTFIFNNNLLSIELTLRPSPAVAVGTENRNYTLKTQVRQRN